MKKNTSSKARKTLTYRGPHSTHVRPYCLNCDSERIATKYESELDGRRIDESETLRRSIDELSTYLAALAETYDGCEPQWRDDPSWRQYVARHIMDLCAMWTVREAKRETADEVRS